MKRKFGMLSNKFLATLMLFGILFQMLAPTVVMAEPSAVDGYNHVRIGGNPTFDAETNRFNYDHGYVTITWTKAPETLDSPANDPVAVTNTDFAVGSGDIIKITFNPDEGYSPELYNNTGTENIKINNIVENVYTFEMHNVANEENTFYLLTPSFVNGNEHQDPPVNDLKFDFVLNGETFINVSMGDDIIVPSNFNLDTIEEFYITKIVDGSRETYEYGNKEFSKEMMGKNGLPIFDIHKNKYSDNYLLFRAEAHVFECEPNPNQDPNVQGDESICTPNILDSDLSKYNKTIDKYFSLYITGINFVKEEFKGVKVSTSITPDNYDFTAWNGADLSSTSLNNPGTVTTYYGEDIINFSSETDSNIETIELVEGKGVPDSAVEINNENKTVKILSNFYNQILVKIKLEDGTTGYININRIGIFINDVPDGSKEFLHGAFAQVGNNFDIETNKQRIGAVFYHDTDTTYEDYDLIVNITYINGETETRIATGVGDVENTSPGIIGSDYLLWSGDSMDDVKKIYVTAVKKGALSEDTEFGGAAFGSGAGVVWENNRVVE